MVADRVIHKTADGRNFLVIHGDQFDAIVHNVRWLAYLGDRAYDLAIIVNRIVGGVRRLFGMPYWSFSSWAKVKVKKAVKFISHFQKIVVEDARRSEVDGVICGHIHHAAMEHMDGVEYINTGDWVESCTAVVEHFDGRMEIIRWMDLELRPVVPAERFVPVVVESGEQGGRRLTAGSSHVLRTNSRVARTADCNSCGRRAGAPIEPADRHARRLGVLGHVECRRERAPLSRVRGTMPRPQSGADVAAPMRLPLVGASLPDIAA